MHTSLCYCVSLNACSDDHLLCYVIIVVISILLFWCTIKLLTCFTSCLLDCNLLVTLYLSFYYLFYLEGLMCLCFKFITTLMTRDRGSDMIREVFIFVLWVLYLCLYPCCFCKLLGFVFIFYRIYGLYHALCSLYALLNQYF